MNKKLFCVIAFFIAFSAFAMAEYWENGARSEAIYKGTTADCRAYNFWVDTEDWIKRRNEPYKNLEKLTKLEKSLLFGAMKEYDYNPGEVYAIVMEEPSKYAMLMLWIEIENDGSFTWYGWQYHCN